jgi:hypothetical protein
METKTAPRHDWKAAIEQVAALDANTHRIPRAEGNAFTFVTNRHMSDDDFDFVLRALKELPPKLTQPKEADRFSLGSGST